MTWRIPVLLMVRELGLGGTERQVTEIAKCLDRSSFEVHVGCFQPYGIRAKELQTAGVPIVHFPVRSLYKPSTFAAALQMGTYIEKHGIRIVHTFDVPANLFGVPVARSWGTHVVLSSQRANRSLTPGLRRQLLRVTDHIVDGVVVNCEAMRRHLIEEEMVPPDLIHLCYNGIDTAEFHSDSRHRGAPLTIGTVGALRPEKGLHTLLDAFSRVHATYSDLELVIVGSGPSLMELKAQSRALDIHESCRFEPATSRVADSLRMIDIFVLPSVSEALSNSLMEAMACGCAVIASRVGGNPELVQDGVSGLLFQPGNVDQLATALRLLIEREDLRKHLPTTGRHVIERKFSLRTAADRMAHIYLGTVR